MGKGRRTRTDRADERRRRQIREARREAPDIGLPGGWYTMGPDTTLDDVDLAAPDDALPDTSGCPVADTCAGCGTTTHLHAVTSAFTEPGGFDIGCATLCRHCDGRAFLHLLDTTALAEAFTRHAGHLEQSITTGQSVTC